MSADSNIKPAVRLRETTGFGCPNEVEPHHFVVDLPAGRAGTVLIAEHYGIKAGINGQPDIAERCWLPRTAWTLIAADVKRDFNERLRAKRLTPSRWTVGVNRVERLLGKELLVLAWAVERAAPDLIPNAVRNWVGLRPEERWWLYSVTAAASGRPDQAEVGWRKALRFALTENPLEDLGGPIPVRSPVKEHLTDSMPLFPGFSEEGPSPFLLSYRGP